MPTVPRLTRSVSPTALPTARLTAAETFASTGGVVAEAKANQALTEGGASQQQWGAFASLGRPLQQLGGVMANIVIEERRQADEVAVMAAQNELTRRVNKQTYDTETGWLTRQGKNALSAPEEVSAQFAKDADEIGATLTTPSQKRAWAKVQADRGAQLDLAVRRHTFGEIQEYKATELSSAVENSVNNAIAQSQGLGDSGADADQNILKAMSYDIRDAVTKLESIGPTLGWGPKKVKAKVLAVTTQAHVGVVESLLVQDKPAAARAYFDGAVEAGQISGEAQSKVVKALEEGTQRKKAQEAFDTITDTLPVEQWTKAARAIDDPKLRDDVENRIEHQKNINERAEREAHEAIGVNAKNIIDQGNYGDITKIPGWRDLTPGEAGQLKNYAEDRVKQVTVKTSPQALHYLISMANSDDPKERADYVKLNMMKFLNVLSPSDWEAQLKLQHTVRKGDLEAASKLLVDPVTQNKMVDEALMAMGMDPSPAQPGTKGASPQDTYRVNEFRRSVRESIARTEARSGKKATDAEVQQVVDVLRTPTGTKVKAKGLIWDTTTPAYAYEVAQAQAKSVADIPPGEKQRIVDALRLKNRPVTDDVVLQLFNAVMSVTRGDVK